MIYMERIDISRKLLVDMLFQLSGMLAIFILLFLHPDIATADAPIQDKKELKPDYVILQSAGYLGFVAMGVGKSFGRHKVNMLLGYVPEDVGGVEIWQYGFKYEWHPSKDIPLGIPEENIRLDPFYIGMSIIYGYHDDLFVNEPSQYPSGYYPPTAFHVTFNIGASLQHWGHTFFLEYTALDVGLVSYIKHQEFFADNYDYFGLEGIGSLAIGVKFNFE